MSSGWKDLARGFRDWAAENLPLAEAGEISYNDFDEQRADWWEAIANTLIEELEAEERAQRTAQQCLEEGHRVRCWWDVPYRHDTELRDSLVVVVTETGTMGEAVGDNEWHCDVCGEVKEPEVFDYE